MMNRSISLDVYFSADYERHGIADLISVVLCNESNDSEVYLGAYTLQELIADYIDGWRDQKANFMLT